MSHPRTGAAIFRKVLYLLIKWNNEDKLFAFTLDNVSSNGKLIELLESHVDPLNLLSWVDPLNLLSLVDPFNLLSLVDPLN